MPNQAENGKGKIKRVMSGVQPTGSIHLGNYFGAMRQHIELQAKYECFYCIVNYHALTTVKDAAQLRDWTNEVALAYLAFGLDPKKTVLYRQSELPEVCELAWFLTCFTGMGLFDRAHSYKDKIAKGISPSVGLYLYPAVMAADILVVGANLVPVGEDQTQHLEMTRDMVGYFNNTFKKEVLALPDTVLSATPKVPGIDGQKMSKSYGNTIDVFMPKKKLKKRIMSIVTDSTPVNEPKDSDRCNVFALLKLFADDSEMQSWEERYRKGPMGYGEAKLRLFELVEAHFTPAWERWEKLVKDPDYVEDVLRNGANRVQSIAGPIMENIRSACGIIRSKA